MNAKATLAALAAGVTVGAAICAAFPLSGYKLPDQRATPGVAATSDPAENSRQYRHTAFEMKEEVAYRYWLARSDWRKVEFESQHQFVFRRGRRHPQYLAAGPSLKPASKIARRPLRAGRSAAPTWT